VTAFDVVVVGAGPIGTAAARYLSAQGQGVCVIGPEEQADFRDHHGVWSGHYDQGRLAAPDVPLVETVMGLRSMRRFAELESLTGIAFHTVHPCLTVMPKELPTGFDDLGGGFFNLAAILDNAQSLAGDGEYLSEAALAERFTQLRFPPGHDGVLQLQAMIVNPRSLVKAQLAAATASGATRVSDEVVGLDRQAGGFALRTRQGDTIGATRIVMAAGAGINAYGLLTKPIAAQVYGCTAVLVEVLEPDVVDFPTLMYYMLTGDVPAFTGIVVPPLQYPDGRWYVKLAGGSVLRCPLNDYQEINSWVRGGGHQEDGPELFAILAGLLGDDVRYGEVRTRPCPLLMSATGRSYIDYVEDGIVLASEGSNGVMMGDEIGRLAAELVMKGRWGDSLPAELFEIKFA
jgi:sarcosine oxidase